MLDKAKTLKETLVRLRRTIHMHPELGFEEHQTGALVCQTLRELNIDFQTGVGKTGIVARLGNGNGPAIGIRGDMDALPILEANDVPYKSQVPGKMHACGHDAHTAMLLGVAMLLKDEVFDGEVRLLFQPSEECPDEEGISGARRMIDDGAVEGLDAVIAAHVFGTLDRGKIFLREGYALANVDKVDAKVIGKGGHGAAPHLAVDPIFMMGPILTALHGITSRRVNPVEPAVVTVGLLQGGTAGNIIPDEVALELTLRSMSDEVREHLIEEVDAALSISRSMGGDYEIKVTRGLPAVYNDPTVTRWLRDTAAQFIGADNIIKPDPLLNADDFAFMSRASRGALFLLGTKKPGGPEKYVHHSEFDIDEDALPLGTAILAQTVLDFVRGKLC